MSKAIDMTGWIMSEHGVPDSRLTVIRREGSNKHKSALWLVECNCEKHTRFIVDTHSIRCGNTKSCGCLTEEARVRNNHQKFKGNIYTIIDDYAIGIASNTDDEFFVSLCDLDKAKEITWCVILSHGIKRLYGYDRQTGNKRLMHDWLGFKNYDHADRNELNNRRENLRECTPQQNSINKSKQKNNTSGIVGVSWYKSTQKWRAQIRFNNKTYSIGYFINKDDAIKARLWAELKYFGPEFAPQRHLFEEYGITHLNTPQND